MEISKVKIIINDYNSFLLIIASPISLVIAGIGAVYGFLPGLRHQQQQSITPETAQTIFVIGAILTILFVVLLFLRISRIKQILQTGERVTAKVTQRQMSGERGRIEFQYKYEKKRYTTGTVIMKNRQTEEFWTGAKIEVAVDPQNPAKAMIVELYSAD